MTAGARGPLAGKGIVVTRPAHQSERLTAALAAAGARAIEFPTIDILPPIDPQALDALIDRLDQFDLAVFISPNSARRAMQAIKARRVWPATLRAATIGRGGVRELELHGLANVIAPARFDSEALLEMPQMQSVSGMRVVIFRGEGGRELLGESLRARGAAVDYAACYRRALAQTDPAPLLAAWARAEIDAVTVTSSEGLRNLCTLIGAAGRTFLQETPLFVPHARIERAARDAALTRVHLTAQGDEGLMAGLAGCFAAVA
jgi:uroporphyrinogen-III synthase